MQVAVGAVRGDDSGRELPGASDGVPVGTMWARHAVLGCQRHKRKGPDKIWAMANRI